MTDEIKKEIDAFKKISDQCYEDAMSLKPSDFDNPDDYFKTMAELSNKMIEYRMKAFELDK